MSGEFRFETFVDTHNNIFNEYLSFVIAHLSKENQGKTILIGSHGVAIEAFLRKIVNLPFTYGREKFCQHNVAINELNFENDKFEIIRLADVDYLNKYKEEERA